MLYSAMCWEAPRVDISTLAVAHPVILCYQCSLIGGCGYATFIILHLPCNNSYMYDCILAQGEPKAPEPDKGTKPALSLVA